MITPADYISRGLSVIPVPHGKKGPTIKGWPDLQINEKNCAEYFPSGVPMNIGAVLGAPSGWLIDVDIDDDLGISIAQRLLPETVTFGRASRPKTHYLYICRGIKTTKYQYSGETLVEIRAGGTQTIVPGSYHSGEKIEFTAGFLEITEIDEKTLFPTIGKLAAAILLAREWRAKTGCRHSLTMALAGGLRNAGWAPDDVITFIGAIVEAAGDNEARDRLEGIRSTLSKKDNSPITGWPSAAAAIGDSAITKIQEWLDIRKDSTQGLIIGRAPQSAEWPEPLPLIRSIPPADPFPVGALGDVLGGMAHALRATIQAPEALCAQSILAAATLAVQAHADIEVDGRTFPTSNFFVAVGESGERKTAIDSAVLAPHRKFQKKLLEQYREDKALFDSEYAAWKKSKEEALSARLNDTRKAKQEALQWLGPEPEPPIHPILVAEEPTYEGLTRALVQGWPAMGLFSDEGGRFLGGHAMNSENQLKTAAGLSALWNGTPLTRTRAGDGCYILYGRRVSLHLLLQPNVAALLLNNETLIGQGLLSRCLICYPKSTIGNRPYIPQSLADKPEAVQYFARIMGVLETQLPLAEGSRNELEPRTISPAPAAKQIWIDFYNHIEILCREGKELYPVRGMACKAAEQALRIAGVLALIQDIHTTEIAPQYVEAGIEIEQFYLNEALRLIESFEGSPDLASAGKLLQWLRDKHYSAITLQDVYQKAPRPIRTREAALKTLRILADHGHVRQSPDKANEWEIRETANF